MVITARTLITQALKTLQILGEDAEPSAGQATDGLALLTELADAWAADGAFCAVVERNTYTLTAGQASRTLGPSGNLVASTLPVGLEDAAVIAVDGTDEYPVKILDPGEYAAIPDKATTASWPYALRLENTFPNWTLKFWPVPSSAATLVLYTTAPFASSSLTLGTSLSLQAGYAKALRLTLAEEFASFFGAPLPPTLRMDAEQARAVIQRKNTRSQRINTAVAGIPGASGGHYDYISGRFI